MEPLGEKLRKRRRRLGLTLDELAQKAGFPADLSLIEPDGSAIRPATRNFAGWNRLWALPKGSYAGTSAKNSG